MDRSHAFALGAGNLSMAANRGKTRRDSLMKIKTNLKAGPEVENGPPGGS